MEFLTVSTLADAFHYASKLEAKQKGKSCFTNNPTGRTYDKKSSTNFDKIIPFKFKMNLDILNLEWNIGVESINNWVQKMKSYYSPNQLSKDENITITFLKMSTFMQCWWENLLTKIKKDRDPIDTWEKFVEYVRKEFYTPKYIEQQYKKWQQLRQWKD